MNILTGPLFNLPKIAHGIALLGLALGLLSTMTLRADNVFWDANNGDPNRTNLNDTDPNDGNWFDTTSWVPHKFPVAGDQVEILDGFDATQSTTVTFNASMSNPSATVAYLLLDGAGYISNGNLVTHTTTFNQSTGTLTVTLGESLGYPGSLRSGNPYYGPVVYNLSGGTDQVGNILSIGEAPLAGQNDGTFNLSGTGNLISGREYIGDGGTGVMMQTDSSTNTVAALQLGSVYSNSDGFYTLSSGSLTVTASENIGSADGSTFTQTGGTHTVVNPIQATDDVLDLGYAPGSTGTYALSGTGQLIAGMEYVGDAGIGQLTQDNAATTNTVLSYLSVGETSNGTGTYTLNDGTLNAFAEDVGDEGQGEFDQNGGTHVVFGTQPLGGTDIATTLQANGTLSIGDFLGMGTFRLKGGTLSAGSEILGNYALGLFVQSEGSDGLHQPTFGVNQTKSLIIGAQQGGSGEYDLEAGQLNAGSEYIGKLGTGKFVQTGGTNTVSDDVGLTVDNGLYDLQSGTLTTPVTSTGFQTTSSGTFTMEGGEQDGYFQNNGSFVYSGGTVNGLLENKGSITLNAPLMVNGGIINEAPLSIPTGTSLLSGGGFQNLAAITMSGGTIGGGENINTGTISGYGTIQSVSFNNTGGVVQASGGTLVINGGGAVIYNAAMMRMTAQPTGQLALVGDVMNDGTLEADTASPGTVQSGGVIVITGNYTQSSTGALNFQISGITPSDGATTSNDYTYVNFYNNGNGTPATIAGVTPGAASATVTLDGALNVTLTNSFAPTPGESFDLLQGSFTTTGQFATLNLPALSNGLIWNTSELYSNGILSVGSTNYYWNGANGGAWNSISNFSMDAAGTVAQNLPLNPMSNVFLTSATGGTGVELLNNSYVINSLNFTGTGTPAASGSVTLLGGSLRLLAATPFSDSNGTGYAAGTGLVVQAGSAAHTIASAITLGSSQTWEIDNDPGAPLTVSGPIDDGGIGAGLIKSGRGSLILAGPATYSGGTIVSAGTLLAGAQDVMPTASQVTVDSGGTFDLNGYDQTVGAIADGDGTGAGVITSSSGSPTLTVSGSNIFTYDAKLTGSLGLTVTNGAAVGLTGADTYTGATNIHNSGTLAVNSSLTGTSSVTVDSYGILAVNGSIGSGIAVNVGAQGTLLGVGDGSTTAVINGPVTVSGGGHIQLVGGGGTTLTVGSLTLGHDTGSYDPGDYASLDFINFGAGLQQLNVGSNGSGSLVLNSSGAYVDIQNPFNLSAGSTYTLINFGSQGGTGSFSLNANTPNVMSEPFGSDILTLVETGTSLQLQVSAFAPPPPSGNVAYFTGNVGYSLGYGAPDTVWSDTNGGITNWSTDQAGNTDAGMTPNASTDVILAANNVGGQFYTLGGSVTINSLNVISGGFTTIADDGSTLTIMGQADTATSSDTDPNTGNPYYNGNPAGVGIHLSPGYVGDTQINAPIIIGGGDTGIGSGTQTWQNDSLGVLVIYGSVTGSGDSSQTQTLRLVNTGPGENLILNGESVLVGTLIAGSISDSPNGAPLGLEIDNLPNGAATALTRTNDMSGPIVVNSGTLLIGNTGATGNSSLNIESSGVVRYLTGVSAGSVFVTNAGSPTGPGGVLQFDDGSDAGFAYIYNGGSYRFGSQGQATTIFTGQSNGNYATIVNQPGNNLSYQTDPGGTPLPGSGEASTGGQTLFTDNASAGNGIILNEGSPYLYLANGEPIGSSFGGSTTFSGYAVAGSVHIENQAGAIAFGAPVPVPGVAQTAAGETDFTGNSSAYVATITNDGATSYNTFDLVLGTYDTANGGTGGITRFFDTSDAGNASITNGGGAAPGSGGLTEFRDNSSANAASILNQAGTTAGGGGTTAFYNVATAGSARIENAAASVGGGSGMTVFNDVASAGTGTITNDGASLGGVGGSTLFNAQSNGGNATITNAGGLDAESAGGTTTFAGIATAGNATIDNEGANGPGTGGATYFIGAASGGTARMIANDAGFVDFSQVHAPVPAAGFAGQGYITVGSIEGSGNFYLGGNVLATGGNNLDTTVTGVIQDGGVAATTGGTLLKVGTGTLALNGANTYTGNTSVENGTVAFNTTSAGATPQSLGEGTDVNLGSQGDGTNGGVPSSGTIQYTGAGGTLDKNITALGNGYDTVQNNGAGLLVLSGTLTKNGTTLNLAGGVNGIEVTGAIVGSKYRSDLNISGGKTILDSSTSSYTGPTNISSTGTLLLAAPNAIPLPADVNLNGGTLGFQGSNLSAMLGTFTMAINSTIDYGQGDTHDTLDFALTNLIDDPNLSVSIDNWSSTDSLVFGGLAPSVLEQISEAGQIKFYSDNGQNQIGTGVFLAGGELSVIAVPEPGTSAMLFVGLGALIGVRVVRRRAQPIKA